MEDAQAFKQFEAASWSSKAPTYGELTGRITRQLVEPLLNAAGVRPGTRVLDVATGPGYVAAAAAMRGGEPVGIDIAEGMVEQARASHPELDFRVADVEALPFEDESFDATVGNCVINHLPHPEVAVAECTRVLAAGGRAAFTVWDDPSENRWMGAVLDAIEAEGSRDSASESQPPGPDPTRFAGDREFRNLLEGAGLTDVLVEPIRLTFTASGAEELWHGMLGGSIRTSGRVASQSPDVVERIRAAFAADLERYRSGANEITMPVAVKLASGRKP
jgi:SAM-dependent methyltransferase